MSKFKLPEPAGYFVEKPLYTHNQLIQALTDLGDEIAGQFSSPNSNYELVIKHMVKELLA